MKLAEDLRRAVLQAGIEGRLTGSDTGALKWVKLWEVCDKIFAGGDKPEHFSKVKSEIYSVPVIANGVTNEGILGYTDCARVTEEAVTVSGRGTIGYAKLRNYSFYPIVRLLVLVPSTRLYTKYLEYALNYLSLNGAGTSIQQLTVPMLRTKLIPLPPLEEQHRIVSRLDSILPLIAELEAAENELEDLKRKFPGDMRDSLLQAAIQGKLTGGNQEGWRWVRLGELGSYKKGPFGSSLTKDIFIPDGDMSVKVYEQKNAIKKDWKLGEYFITQEYYERSMKSFTVSPGDIIVSCAGTIGETYILPADSRIGIINQALMRISLIEAVDKDFYLFCFNHIIKNMAQRKSQGTAIKNIPPLSVLRNMIIPLPPLEEQKQIVSRLNELLPLCEALEKIN